MYLRFVSSVIHKASKKPRGLFAEACELLDSGELTEDEQKHLQVQLDWFNEHLPHPPKKFKATRAVFWFREDATECISKIWGLVHILQLHGRHITIQKCRHLRNRTYSDDFQVAAYPHPLDDRIIEH